MALVALRGLGDDAVFNAIDPTQQTELSRPKLSPTAIVVWTASIAAVGWMFWATVYKAPKRRARA